VIGLVRSKFSTEQKMKEELSERSNIHIVQADITDYAALQVSTPNRRKDSANTLTQAAVAETANITGGGLDYLIANAGVVSHFDAYDPIGVL
jgi:NAD(P)-dependent dehydrogenase (short-subunit alcohol dehydrogenase family)